MFVYRCHFWTYWQPVEWKQWEKRSLLHPENERQQSVDGFRCCVLSNLRGDRLLIVIKVILTAIISKNESNTPPAPSWKWVSTERQQFLALLHGKWKRNVTGDIYKWSFDCVCILKHPTVNMQQLCKWDKSLLSGRLVREYTLPICLSKLPNHCL